MRNIAILGSTGSIGTQAVEVVESLGSTLSVSALSAHSDGETLAAQAGRLKAGAACLSDSKAAQRYVHLFEELGVRLYPGREGLLEMVEETGADLVLNSIVGSAGLGPTLRVLEGGTDLALANKESLVAGGRLVTEASAAGGARVIPVDSEHSAIFQCLRGESPDDVEKLILTASGGPFLRTPAEEMGSITVEMALRHPTWSMGRKITVDSATLMNKGLEVIEAHHLFGIGLDRIEVLVHQQSVVHSMVVMVDGSVLAHLGVPDMRVPIQYSLTYPRRVTSPVRPLSFGDYPSLGFEAVDHDRFPCLGLAIEAGRAGGTAPAAMSAANEVAVGAFLDGRIGFTGIPVVVETVLERHRRLPGDDLSEIVEAEKDARRAAAAAVESLGGTA